VGCKDAFRYSILKLADWRERHDELETRENPFATVVLAHLGARDTRRDVHGRQTVKLALVRRLYAKGYSRERVLSLFRFIDWLLALPEAAEQAVDRAIAQLEEERRMPYITGIEYRARAGDGPRAGIAGRLARGSPGGGASRGAAYRGAAVRRYGRRPGRTPGYPRRPREAGGAARCTGPSCPYSEPFGRISDLMLVCASAAASASAALSSV
jgi:hypothetical protein